MRAAPNDRPLNAQILLVDDNPLGLTARKAILEELGCQVTAVRCAEEALQQFAAGKFDLVITGHRLPNMDGIQLIQQIRHLAPEQPTILISGLAETLGLDERSTGADLVIQKSAKEVEHLVRGVHRLLRQRRPARKPPARHPLSVAHRQGQR